MQNGGFAEEFKPIPIRPGRGALGIATFALRPVLDLQFLTCLRFLSPKLRAMHGAVLDVGCGDMPFRDLLPSDARYTGLDVPRADDFGMTTNQEVVVFDGLHIPFPDNHFDNIMCTEVLEHAEDPVGLIAEMHRVLRPGGTLVATMPFSARVHHAPHDFNRFTRYGLLRLFSNFGALEVVERGDDLAAVANKLIVVCMRLVRPSWTLLWRLPILVFVAIPIALLALAVAHLSMWLELGSKADPLGYGVVARKS